MLPNKNEIRPPDFKTITLKLASPERILSWSRGEVTKPETINYRTGRAERNGLFDERIFGPEKDYECYCGKYKRIRYKDIVCEKCGVEVTKSIVRRERMGHVELASPVAHIWFLRGVPSRLGLLLDLSIPELEKVIYFAGYIVITVDETEKARLLKELENEYKNKIKTLTDEEAKEKLKNSFQEARRQLEILRPWLVLDELAYHRLSLKFGRAFTAGIGAEAIHKICRELNLDQLLTEIETALTQASTLERARLMKRRNLLKAMKYSGVRPDWMFLTIIPVIPPALRPMVALEGGRHATSDINDLYRRVINRNNRLKKLIELKAPEVILRNEKRILQEAVDALIHNSIRRRGGENVAGTSAGRRPLKSLADNLIGKQGRFRQNLLGKRVDYSGRSVIVVGPELKLSQCGLPKHMALELFKPFIVGKILERELAFHIRGANRLIEEGVPEVWAILEEVITDKYVFLNRAPTLHRLGIQAFRPVLVEGNAIHIHPLVCVAFNADFDGDQMAVHVPLSEAAQREARELIAADKNLLKPGNGDPIISMRMDIVLGCYWVTKLDQSAKGAGRFFPTPNAAIMAYDFGEIDIRAPIKLLGGKKEKYGALSGQLFETSVGRILFNYSLPSDRLFINQEIGAKDTTALIEEMIDRYGVEQMPPILDKIKKFGFRWATMSGITWGLDDVIVPAGKQAIVDESRRLMREVEKDYEEGWLSAEEKYRQTIEIWQRAKNEIEKLLPETIPEDGSVADMLRSKARGSWDNVSQMAGMKGLINNPANRLIEFPIIQSYKEGLSPIEYFVTTHGSRKTLADTALNTAKAGFLTRRLVDVAQEVIVAEKDCSDREGKLITIATAVGFEKGLAALIRGRVLAKDLISPDGTLVYKKGTLLGREEVARIDQLNITSAVIRSPLSCRSVRGVCQQCYGADLGRGGLVQIGEPVGVIAAQAIGEPGTQLTLRTKHSGGVAGSDIVGGLPRVEELFERRTPKRQALLSEIDGYVVEIKPLEHGEKMIVILPAVGSKRKKKTEEQIEYRVSPGRTILVKPGDEVVRGAFLTDGAADLLELFKLAGREALEDYIVREVNAIYSLHGGSIAPKHIEIIIRQMLSRRRIKNSGTTRLLEGEVVEEVELWEANEEAEKAGGEPAEAEVIVLGITEAALNTSSFLAAVSFQHAARVLIDTAIRGGFDKLRGLKENVIIGRLIPAGTGLDKSQIEAVN